MRRIFRIAVTLAVLGVFAAGGARSGYAPEQSGVAAAASPAFADAASARKLDLYMEAYVTGYNTVREQTDGDPCIAASGANICGRRDTVACPRLFGLGTIVEIGGRKYICEDRTAKRF